LQQTNHVSFRYFYWDVTPAKLSDYLKTADAAEAARRTQRLALYARSNRGLFFSRPRVTLDKLAHQNAYLLPEKQ